MKKALLSLLATISLLAGSTLVSSPASAAVFPNGGDVNFTVGDSVNLDLGCQEPGITSVYFGAGELPPGLSMDAQGKVTGTPTTVGDYKVSNYSCYWGSSGVSWANWYLTFKINPLATPVPVLAAHSLNTNDCSFYIGLLFPQTPDANSVTLRIENQAGTVYTDQSKAALQVPAGTYSEINMPIDSLNFSITDPNYTGVVTGTEPFACGDTLSIQLSYQWRGAPAATSSVSGFLVDTPPKPSTSGAAPVAKLMNLNNADCEFRVVAKLPTIPKPGSTKLVIGTAEINGEDRITFTVDDTTANGLMDFTFSPQQLSNKTYNSGGIASADDKISTSWECGSLLHISVNYEALDGASWSSTWNQSSDASVTPTKPAENPTPTGGVPIQKLTVLNNQACEFRIIATLPSTPKPGSTHITINLPSSGVDQIVLTIEDEFASGIMDLTFSPETLASGTFSRKGIASFNDQINTDWACGATYYVGIDYRDLQDNFFHSSWRPDLQTDGYGVTPTRPDNNQNNPFSISVARSSLGKCSIVVLATLPDAARPIALGITRLGSEDILSGVVVNGPFSENGQITAILSLASKTDIQANVPVEAEDKIFLEPVECTGSFRAIIVSPGGVLASALFTLTKNIPACNAGSILNEETESCILVARGFYTTELNSSTPIACPAGMTTETMGSKSRNDCYKPIVQAITGFKAPKAVKFKAITDLAITTNTNVLAGFKAMGSCTAKIANVVTKVKGKNVIVKKLRVTATSKAGNCSLTLNSKGTGRYLDLNQKVTIKVSKTGK